MDNQKRYGGKMRPLWVLAGAYLLYLAYRQVELCWRSEAETRGQVIICVVSAAVFAAVGAWVLWREWKYARMPAEDDNSGNENTPDDSHGDSTPDDSSGENTPDDSGESGEDA